MALFRNTKDLKKFADIHLQTDWDTLKPYVEQAEVTYIIPFISKSMYDTMHSLMNDTGNANKTFEQIFTNPFDLEAFKRIGKALANYSLFEALPFLNTAVGDLGVAQQSSKEGTTNPAAQWRYNDRRLAHLDNADRFTDQLLDYLEEHKDHFTQWASSASFTINKDLFIATSAKLSQYIPTNGSRRAFIAMRATIRLAEKKYIIPAIGEEMFNELKTQMQTNPASISTNNLKLIPYIEEALAWAAYTDYLPFASLKFSTDGVYVISSNDAIVQKVAASTEQKTEAAAAANGNKLTFLASLKKFIDDHVDDYPTYKSSTTYETYNPRYTVPCNSKRSGHFRV
jgi:hypothetical protein